MGEHQLADLASSSLRRRNVAVIEQGYERGIDLVTSIVAMWTKRI